MRDEIAKDLGQRTYFIAEDQKVLSTHELHHRTNTLRDSYSQPKSPHSTKNPEQISSPLAPPQNPWAEPGDTYPENKNWEQYQSPAAKAEEENVRVIHQGHTKLEMNTNSGLAMGNVTSRRAAIVGQYFYDFKQVCMLNRILSRIPCFQRISASTPNLLSRDFDDS